MVVNGEPGPIMITAGSDWAHRRGIYRHFDKTLTLDSCTTRREELHCMCCCVLTLVPEMARVTGEWAPAFTAEELEKLVDGVLPLYAKLYGQLEEQVRRLWQAIAKEVQTLEVYNRQSTHCRKRWEDLRHWSRKTAEAQLGKASQQGRGAYRTLTPPMARILAVAYPDLDGRIKAAQQPQGASSGEGAVAPVSYDARAHHGSQEAESTDVKGTSGLEAERSTMGEATTTGGSDSDTSSDDSSLVVVDPTGPTHSFSSPATPHTITALPGAPHRVARARSPRKVGVSFAPGTSSPAPASPAALTEEAIDLLRTISVGQTTIVNAIQGLASQMQKRNAYLEGIHCAMSGLQRSFRLLPPL
ncbi:hypothetical protein NDU88_004303 [Pleurodeles waltl]|uniref:Myb-like domain-containing protein n=1 Tax=Pleurodeles waltl TaxID=8319 RepID=A0AAV7QBJ6_PLEWA|nr:hypothetical protein NDU88_004303 [Pleurodeles waltl]